MQRFKMATLREDARLRPPGYFEDCIKPPAVIDKFGKWIEIPDHRWNALRLTYGETRPSFLQKSRGFFREVLKWKQSGFRVVHWRAYLARRKACMGCPFVVPGIFPTCGRCGCTRAKLWLETARCPERRWRD